MPECVIVFILTSRSDQSDQSHKGSASHEGSASHAWDCLSQESHICRWRSYWPPSGNSTFCVELSRREFSIEIPTFRQDLLKIWTNCSQGNRRILCKLSWFCSHFTLQKCYSSLVRDVIFLILTKEVWYKLCSCSGVFKWRISVVFIAVFTLFNCMKGSYYFSLLNYAN